MPSARKQYSKKICKTCSIDFTAHFGYDYWEICEVCYWKGRLEECNDIAILQDKKSEIKTEPEHYNQKIEEINIKIKNRRSSYSLRDKLKYFLFTTDNYIMNMFNEINQIKYKRDHVNDFIFRAQSEVNQVLIIRKKLERAKSSARVWQRVEQINKSREKKFTYQSKQDLSKPYDRKLFDIRNKDYRRGNLLDNMVRKELKKATLEVFNHRCLYCETRDDLTLDHFGLTKNEGGNFILALRNKKGIRINIVILCRSCNASKGEISYQRYFDDSTIKTAYSAQEKLLDIVLNNREAMRVAKSWYGIDSI
jgi:5-methylcytosine-specific restriction endonuclease McrA